MRIGRATPAQSAGVYARTMRTALALTACVSVLSSAPASAWDASGHRSITWLALDGLASDAPAFLREPAVRHMVGWQSPEPDRWRNVPSAALRHENAPEHYLDIEDLEGFGLTLDTVNPLRARFISDLAIARREHPEKAPPYNPKLDPAGDKEFPGFALHSIMEDHAKLISGFRTYRILTALNQPARAAQVEMAKANVMVSIGLLAHMVGDLAQPLHTTKHFNGWAGDNPKGYTTDKKFHAYIDGGVVALHGLRYATLKPTQTYPLTVADPLNPWPELLVYVRRSHDRVEPLYALEQSGGLRTEEGRTFIAERMNDGAAMLAALINAAWSASEPDRKAIEDFERFDGFRADELPDDAR